VRSSEQKAHVLPVVDPDSLMIGEHGQITGLIHISVDGYSFPDAQWNDFTVVVLVHWMNEVVNKAPEFDCDGYFRFFDGAFYFQLKTKSNVCTVECHEDGLTDRVIFVSTFDFPKFIKSLVKAANAVLRACKTRGWDTRELKELEHSHMELAALQRSLKESRK